MPAVAGDSLFVGSCNGVFRRLDTTTGDVRWETNVGGNASKYFLTAICWFSTIESLRAPTSTRRPESRQAFMRSNDSLGVNC
jgi:hypothetical protein